MGTRIPPNAPGNQCTVCFGVGKTFGQTDTPKILEVILQDLEPGPAWNTDLEGTILTRKRLIQQANPCEYSLREGDVLFFWRWGGSTTLYSVEDVVTPTEYFRGSQGGVCLLELDNDLLTSPFIGATGGVALASWNPEDV